MKQAHMCVYMCHYSSTMYYYYYYYECMQLSIRRAVNPLEFFMSDYVCICNSMQL